MYKYNDMIASCLKIEMNIKVLKKNATKVGENMISKKALES